MSNQTTDVERVTIVAKYDLVSATNQIAIYTCIVVGVVCVM